jgi:hypothetical protein
VIKKLALVLLGFWLGGAASATTYTYVGPNFQFIGGVGYTTSMSITGTFDTASPLAANMPLTDIGPAPGGLNLVTAWSFTDGVNTYTQANSIPFGNLFAYFRVQTDALGNINGFYIQFSGPLPPNAIGNPMHVITMTTPTPQSQGINGALCTAVTGTTCTAVGPGPNYGDSTSSGAFTPNGVAAPPTIIKSFGAANMPVGGTTSLSFTIGNPNAATALSGVGFTDTLPAGLVIATPNGLTGSCGAGTITATAGSGSLSLTGATLAASATCNFSANVTSSSAGVKTNVTSAVNSIEGGAGGTATAVVTVAPAAPPTIAKSFGAASIPVFGTTSLTFVITNPNAALALTGIGFTDTLPASMVVATPNGLSGTCGGGTITATAGSASVALTGASLAGSTNCTFSVNIMGTSASSAVNTTGAVTSNEGGSGGTASAGVTIAAATPATGIPALDPRSLGVLMLLLLAAGLGLLSRRKR